MDVGREVKKISGDLYSLRLIFKEFGRVKHETKETRGKVYFPNIDEKGKIYLPRDMETHIKDKPYFFLGREFRFLSLSAFGYIIFLRETKLREAYERIVGRKDARVAICVSPCSFRNVRAYPYQIMGPGIKRVAKKRKSKFPREPFLCSPADITLKAYFARVNLDVEFYERGKISERVDSALGLKPGYEPEEKMARLCERHHQYEKAVAKRMRLTVPWFFLNYIEITKSNVDKAKVVLFDLDEEIEIWEKNAWMSNINKVRWYSEVAKIIRHSESKIKSRLRTWHWSNLFRKKSKKFRVHHIYPAKMRDEVIDIAFF